MKTLGSILQANLGEQILAGRTPGGAHDKGDPLTTFLTIANLGVAALGTLISLIALWRQDEPSYSVTTKIGSLDVSVENLSHEQLEELARKLEKEQITFDVARRSA